jgi:hypothetical protein
LAIFVQNSCHSSGVKQPTCQVAFRKAALNLTGYNSPCSATLPALPVHTENFHKTRNPLKNSSYIWKMNGTETD